MEFLTCDVRQVARPIVLAAALATLTGCAAVGGSGAQTMHTPNSGAVQHSFAKASVVSAWQLAEQSRQSGDFMGAFRHLRKALEIEPSDPVIWSRLAEMALRLNKSEPAEKYAERSNQLAAGNTTLIYRNWLIIQRAREVNNDIEGADEALRKANQYRP
ncbi:MAG: tetratricopeptide repeat protein [Granulosicoccaceae bacterium]